MPPNERVRLHDRQDAPPLDQRRQRAERYPSGIVGTPRLHLPLNVERQLLPQKQILCCELRVGAGRRGYEAEQIDGNGPKNSDASPATGLRHVQESYTGPILGFNGQDLPVDRIFADQTWSTSTAE